MPSGPEGTDVAVAPHALPGALVTEASSEPHTMLLDTPDWAEGQIDGIRLIGGAGYPAPRFFALRVMAQTQ